MFVFTKTTTGSYELFISWDERKVVKTVLNSDVKVHALYSVKTHTHNIEELSLAFNC